MNSFEYFLLHSLIEDQDRNSRVREKVANVGRPTDPAPASGKSKYTKTAEIKMKIIDEVKEMPNDEKGYKGFSGADKPRVVTGGKTPVDLHPTTDDQVNDTTKETADSKKTRRSENKQIGQPGAPAMKEGTEMRLLTPLGWKANKQEPVAVAESDEAVKEKLASLTEEEAAEYLKGIPEEQATRLMTAASINEMNGKSEKEERDERNDEALKAVKKKPVKEDAEHVDEGMFPVKHPGALHKELGVPQGEKIPAGKLAAAAHKGGKLGMRAREAENMKKIHEEWDAAAEVEADELMEAHKVMTPMTASEHSDHAHQHHVSEALHMLCRGYHHEEAARAHGDARHAHLSAMRSYAHSPHPEAYPEEHLLQTKNALKASHKAHAMSKYANEVDKLDESNAEDTEVPMLSDAEMARIAELATVNEVSPGPGGVFPKNPATPPAGAPSMTVKKGKPIEPEGECITHPPLETAAKLTKVTPPVMPNAA